MLLRQGWHGKAAKDQASGSVFEEAEAVAVPGLQRRIGVRLISDKQQNQRQPSREGFLPPVFVCYFCELPFAFHFFYLSGLSGLQIEWQEVTASSCW